LNDRQIFITPHSDLGKFNPTPQQELLLQAALLSGNAAVNAWEKWKSIVDIDLIDYASMQIFPLLYQNLKILEIDDPQINIYKGLFRSSWYENQRLLKTAVDLVTEFQSVGIDCLFLKGTALILEYIKTPGLRPMGDIDILVKPNHVCQAVDYFEKTGWVPTTDYPDLRKEAYFTYHHSVGFANQRDQHVDLHRSLLFPSPIQDSDADFWDGAVQSEIDGLPVLILNPTDMLIHTCIHGLREHNAEIFRWIADAMTILKNKSSQIDWERLIDQTRKRRLVPELSNGLAYLAYLLDAPIPPQVLGAIGNEKVSTFERWEYNYAISDKRPLGRIPGFWFYYVRCLNPEFYMPIRLKFSGFLSYLQLNWKANNLWELGRLFLTKSMRRIRGLFKSGQPAVGG